MVINIKLIQMSKWVQSHISKFHWNDKTETKLKTNERGKCSYQ